MSEIPNSPSRQILLNPGPVTLSDRVRSALVRGDWCHREPEFAALTRDINAGLAAVYPDLAPGFQAVTLACSGTGAVEAMLATFCPDDRSTLVVANGVYGERMARILSVHGKPHRLAQHAWTAAPDPEGIRRYLDRDSSITHLAVVHHETTTGRLNRLDAIGALCRERNITLLLDAVSSFGAEAIDAGAWNLGALAATANKCLHGVPGLSFVLARRELWTAADPTPRSLYLDLAGYHRTQHGDGFSPFTLPVQVAFALREALAELAEEGGWEARRRRYRERAERIAATLGELGVTPLLPTAEYSSVLWSWRLPAGRSYGELHDALKARGFVIYAGQGDLGREIFRIAHMGDIGTDDLDRLCGALREILGQPA
jgi:2-aminoethylphosphonate-pyruvate transaminase